jgi:hypothetical protein
LPQAKYSNLRFNTTIYWRCYNAIVQILPQAKYSNPRFNTPMFKSPASAGSHHRWPDSGNKTAWLSQNQ